MAKLFKISILLILLSLFLLPCNCVDQHQIERSEIQDVSPESTAPEPAPVISDEEQRINELERELEILRSQVEQAETGERLPDQAQPSSKREYYLSQAEYYQSKAEDARHRMEVYQQLMEETPITPIPDNPSAEEFLQTIQEPKYWEAYYEGRSYEDYDRSILKEKYLAALHEMESYEILSDEYLSKALQEP